MPNFQTIKNLQKAWNDITITNLQMVLNTTKKTYLNQATNKEYLLKFSYLINPKIKCQTHKNPLIIHQTMSLEIGVSPLGLWSRLGSELHDIYNLTLSQLQTKCSAA